MLRAGAVGPGRQASRVSVPSCCRTRQRHAARTAKAMSVVTLPSLSDMAASIDSAALAHISKIDQAGWTPASDSSSGVAVLVVIGIGLLASYAAYSVQDKSAMGAPQQRLTLRPTNWRCACASAHAACVSRPAASVRPINTALCDSRVPLGSRSAVHGWALALPL